MLPLVTMFSQRISQAYFGPPEFLFSNLDKTNSDLYDPDSNPHGYVNLGTAVNALCEQEITQWLRQPGRFEHQNEWQHYYQLRFFFFLKRHICCNCILLSNTLFFKIDL